ncbi:MAG TPA: sigma-70 family RNA polymerase sigma factor [Gemmatimonadaceae bacterium]|jgi:RNA polymerase sigma-70 factor (ECF subfamily)|nr:sigma-70 family RNA polymerase sigma factor [Gemmatimonadaceae bacterium]
MAQRGADLERFERVVLPHLDDGYTLARHLLRDEHDAQDVVQDAVLRALRYFDGYRDGDARAWLLAIVRNCCLTWQRRHRGDRLTVPFGDDVAERVSDSRETDTLAIERSDRAMLERAVAALPTEFREVIVLREVEGLSYKEISDVIGAPMGTVMSRLARARKRLASVLGLDVREAS